MKRANPYDEDFFVRFVDTSEASARAIVPKILALFNPASVVDVGCGEGIWLTIFAEHGVRRIMGVDGDYVVRERLRIPQESFTVRDLSKRFELPETFSLVMSLEVAEHLSPSCAETFVSCLVALGKVVAFSAAVPYQTGVHHVNLRWQDYWAGLFAAHGYVAVDALRPAIWHNQSISFYYRQNILLFVEKDHLESHPLLVHAWEKTHPEQLAIAHPEFVGYLGKGISDEALDAMYLGQVAPRLPRMIRRAIGRRLRLMLGRRHGD